MVMGYPCLIFQAGHYPDFPNEDHNKSEDDEVELSHEEIFELAELYYCIDDLLSAHLTMAAVTV